jgi:hypothetical protein
MMAIYVVEMLSNWTIVGICGDGKEQDFFLCYLT